jgi:hypothetical protein
VPTAQTSIVIEIFRSTELDDLADGIAEDREDASRIVVDVGKGVAIDAAVPPMANGVSVGTPRPGLGVIMTTDGRLRPERLQFLLGRRGAANWLAAATMGGGESTFAKPTAAKPRSAP